MKLNLPKIEIERSTTFNSQNFDIGDKRIVLEILRSKLYSNPIQTICQEIMSNARDAHREVGKNNIPIEVKLPNKLEPSFYIHDFGPGITPDRMTNVFIQYGKSTKREDDTLCGTYGIGAKSPFSLVDAFTIISITPENNVMIRREYLAHIDESGLGQMSCVKEEPTSDPQGTTILLYPKETDFNNFAHYTKQAADHWDVRPKILGDPEFQWNEIKISYQGNGWEIHDISPLGMFPSALIDGISYPLNLKHIYPEECNSYNQKSIYTQISRVPLRLKFKIGEVPVTANREEIDYQSNVITYIKEKINLAIEELKIKLTANLKNATSLRNAVIVWQELRRKTYGNFLAKTQWNDLNLSEFETIHFDDDLKLEGIISHYKRDSHAIYNCRKAYGGWSLNINYSTLIIENDLKIKSTIRPRIATLFDQNPKITYIAVVDFTKIITKETLPTGEIKTKIEIADEKIISTRKEKIEKQHHWSLLDIILLSTVAPKKITNVTKKNSTYKIIKVKKLQILNETCEWIEPDEKSLEGNKTKLYVVLNNKKIAWNKLELTNKDLPRVMSLLGKMIAILDPSIKVNLEIFGVLPSYLKKLEKNWQPFYGLAEKLFLKFKTVIPNQFGSDYAVSRKFSYQMTELLADDWFINQLPKENLLLRYTKTSQEINEASNKVGIFNDLAAYFGHEYLNLNKPENQKDLKLLFEQVSERYSLLNSLNLYGRNNEIEKEILSYIKMKDQSIIDTSFKNDNIIT